MRTNILFFYLAFLFISCSNLDDVNSRLDKLEGEVRDLKTAVSVLENAFKNGKTISALTPYKNAEGNQAGWDISFTDGSSVTIYDGKNGDSIFKDVEIKDSLVTFTMANGAVFVFQIVDNTPRLLSIEFLSKDNYEQLIENVKCTIEGDSLVTCWVPYIMEDKQLVPHFSFTGEKVVANNIEVTSDKTRIDFSKPLILTISGDGKETQYKVLVHAFTGLPVMWIETEGRTPISSKEEYLKAHMRLVEDVVTRAPGETFEADLEIKGRGNSTWGYAKKPYRLKFNKKVSLFGEPEDKSWVLLANYLDKTFLRNRLAFYLGSISNLDYTPKSHFVELMLNGRYNGTYELCDKIKVSENRVNVGKDGFLIEIDALSKNDPDAITFTTEYIDQPINIKEPEVAIGDDQYTYIKNYVCEAENVLYSDNYLDPNTGWQKYLDLDSFVDWYIINEISRNNDAWRWSSTFMNLKMGGKLKMGPIWDFDRSFGNATEFTNFKTEGFWLNDMGWYSRLFQDPVFVTKVKERYSYFYAHKEAVLQRINADAQYLKYSAIENNNKWNIFYNFIDPNYNIWGNYLNEVQCLKDWTLKRMDWLKSAIDLL